MSGSVSQISPFGELLAEKRKESGLSCRALGRIVGVSHTAIHNVERGKLQRLAPEHWKALSSAIGIPVKELEAASERGICPACNGTGRCSA
jgi:DNA-binding XRE family transcriptional regulator